jgi:TP901 family phage tail tape measure protein
MRADPSTLDAGLSEGTSRVQGSLSALGVSWSQLGMIVTAYGAAVTAALSLSTKSAAEFGTGIAKIASLGAKDLEGMEKAAKDAAIAVGGELGDATEGIYQALSAGIPENNIYEFIQKAAIAAAGSQATLTDAVDLGTTIVNAFGTSAQKAFDQAAVAAMVGKTELDLMAGSIGQVAATFANLEGNSDQLFASIAALTLQGVQTSEAMTGIKATLSALATPTDKAMEAAKLLGVEFDITKMKTMGFTQYLRYLYKTAEDTKQLGILPLMFPMEALNTVLILGGKGAKIAADSLQMMNKEGSASKEMFDRLVAADPSFAFRQLKTEVNLLWIELGKQLLPVMKDLVDTSRPYIQQLTEWVKVNQDLTATIKDLVSYVKDWVVWAAEWIRSHQELAETAFKVGTALGLISLALGPLIPLIGVVGGLVWTLAGVKGLLGLGTAATGAATALGTAGLAGVLATGGALAVGLAAIAYDVLQLAIAYQDLGESIKEINEAEYGTVVGQDRILDQMDKLGIKYDLAAMKLMTLAERTDYLAHLTYEHGLQAEIAANKVRWAAEDMADTGRKLTDAEVIEFQNREGALNGHLSAENGAYFELARSVEDIYDQMTWNIIKDSSLATESIVRQTQVAISQMNLASEYAWAAEQRRRPQGAGPSGFAASGGYGYQPANGLDWWGGGDWQWANNGPAFLGMSGFSPDVINAIQHGATIGGAPVPLAQNAFPNIPAPPTGASILTNAYPQMQMPETSRATSTAGIGSIVINITGPIDLSSKMHIREAADELGEELRLKLRGMGVRS